MAKAAPRRCPRCPGLLPCAQHSKQRSSQGRANHELYNSTAWRRARLAFLADHPLCECDDCKRNGWLKPATVVDHVIPHKGDLGLFWDVDNWRANAKRCHDIKTARENGFGK